MRMTYLEENAKILAAHALNFASPFTGRLVYLGRGGGRSLGMHEGQMTSSIWSGLRTLSIICQTFLGKHL